MKDGFIKVAAATPAIKIADTEHNARAIVSLIQEANKEKIKLLVFPELCITGYTINDLITQESIYQGTIEAIEYIQNATKDIKMLIFIGAPLKNKNCMYNTAVAINEGNILGVIPKSHPNNSTYYEKRYFSAFKGENTQITISGNRYPFGTKLIFRDKNINNFTVAAELCEELWQVCPPSSISTAKGAHIIANLAASNDIIGKEDFLTTQIKAQSTKAVCGYIFANAGEGESTTDMVFSGKNFIFEYGECVAQSESFTHTLIQSEIDVEKLNFERIRTHSFTDDCMDYEFIEFCTDFEKTKLSRNISPYPFLPSHAVDLKVRTEKVMSILSNGLKKRVSHIKADCVIIGVSGGLDSSFALIVAAKAMELLNRSKKDILAVTLPCFGTTSKSLENATKLIKYLDVSFLQIDITKAVKLHLNNIGHSGKFDITYENAQARERMQVLMDIANQKNGLVVGTGNLSESALGFSTYNGDHMSMYALNNCVPKTLLKKMVTTIADDSAEELKQLLYEIANAPISPELLPSANGQATQNTETIIGPYELHDFFLYHLIRWGSSPEKVFRLANYAFKNYKKEELLHWLKLFIRRFFASQFKRSSMPDCPQIGTVSLSPRTSWRMPSDASAELWINRLNRIE